MNRNILLLFVCTLASTSVLAHSQEKPAENRMTPRYGNESERVDLFVSPDTRYEGVLRQGLFGSTWGRSTEEQEIQESARALRTAESSEDRKAAEQTLRSLLAADYDARLKNYEEHLDAMEDKLKGMRKTPTPARREVGHDRLTSQSPRSRSR